MQTYQSKDLTGHQLIVATHRYSPSNSLCIYLLQLFGDFPIINQPLADEMEALREASKRFPRNEVARFIISDLDKAYAYMSDVDMATTRINKDVG